MACSHSKWCEVVMCKLKLCTNQQQCGSTFAVMSHRLPFGQPSEIDYVVFLNRINLFVRVSCTCVLKSPFNN